MEGHSCSHSFCQVTSWCAQHRLFTTSINTREGVVPVINHGEAGLLLEVVGHLWDLQMDTPQRHILFQLHALLW